VNHTTPTTPTLANLNPIERLAVLATQRTVRTDRLHGAVGVLLARLAAHVEVGDLVTVDGWTLARVLSRSNVGQSEDWDFYPHGADCANLDGRSCDPDRPVGETGYLHGDFNAPWRGPSRADLLAFAKRAGAFVDALIAKHEKTLATLVAAEQAVQVAAAQIPEQIPEGAA
jgi:hypothetical protein